MKLLYSEIKAYVETLLGAFSVAVVSTAAGTFTALTASTGAITATLGNIVATAGDIIATAGDITATAGDLAAVGGFRTVVGPFTAPGAAGVTAASQTDLGLRYVFDTAAVIDFVATRAGSVMGLSIALDTACTTAGQAITCKVTINGTEIVGGPEPSCTTDGGETEASAVIAKDVAAAVFAAGDTIGVSYTSGTIGNTPKLVATVEIEQ